MATTDSSVPGPLPLAQLVRRCDEADLPFETTADLEPLSEVRGQERAVSAIALGLTMQHDGYNLFAVGPQGLDKHGIVARFVEEKSTQRPAPDDWCYVNNFDNTRCPDALRLPAGQGRLLRDAMAGLVDDLQAALQQAFSSDDYRNHTEALEEEFKEKQQAVLEEIQKEAAGHGIALLQTPMGYTFAPTREGKVISPDIFNKLPEEEQHQFEELVETLEKKLSDGLRQMPQWVKETREKVTALNNETADFAVSTLFADIENRFSGHPEVGAYLKAVHQDVLDNFDVFLADGQGKDDENAPPFLRWRPKAELIRRYTVNLVVDNGDMEHAPLVLEDEPSYERLFGHVEYRAEMGTLATDFSLIRSGALHRANGGYLMLDIRNLLIQPMAYEALKRALKAKQIRIEPLMSALGLPSTMSLEPETIPLDVKLILLGEPELYYLLTRFDPDFPLLFKAIADFDSDIDRNAHAELMLSRKMADLIQQHDLLPLQKCGAAKVIDIAARHVADSEKLSLETNFLRDLLLEADLLARQETTETIAADHIRRAHDAQIYRAGRINDRLQEQITRGTILVDTEGTRVGQINGLSVYSLGHTSFGKPTRITARIRLGAGQLVDIEREVELGGPLHSKGVLILSGYLGATYATDQPLSLSASLVFEQSYGGVDGDSASSTELYALLSALSEVPLRQDLAVTGSVNQLGQVQAIGGVNEKVEGFFDLCQARGLTGTQGVVIPASNTKHLMLHDRVLKAVEAGKFHIYAVETIDQGLSLLTGRAAGARDDAGAYPADSVNGLVEQKLRALAEQRRFFGTSGGKDTA